MQPPLEVRSGLKFGVHVLRMSNPAGVENANHSKHVGEIFQALIELLFQKTGRPLPLTFQDDSIAASQLDPDIWCTFPAAALRLGLYAAVTERLS